MRSNGYVRLLFKHEPDVKPLIGEIIEETQQRILVKFNSRPCEWVDKKNDDQYYVETLDAASAQTYRTT